MSEVLLDFIAPYREEEETDEDLEELISIGVVAWNLALLPVIEREKALDACVEAALPWRRSRFRRFLWWIVRIVFRSRRAKLEEREREIVREFRAIVREMVERKQQRFEDNRRFILGFEVTDQGEDFHLLVASTLDAGGHIAPV